jgi:hypothetical protein
MQVVSAPTSMFVADISDMMVGTPAAKASLN